MTRAILDTLTAAQRQRLAAAQTDPRARAAVLGVAKPARGRSASATPIVPAAYVEAGDGRYLVAVVLHIGGMRLVNVANAREHWSTRKRRVTSEHDAVNAAVRLVPSWQRIIVDGARRWRVTITREGRGVLDDDGLAISAKGVRDAVAAALGVDDAPDAPVTWCYAQQRAQAYAVTVRVEVIA